MTEAEWLVCYDPEVMLRHIRKKASQRKLRLFAVACCRQVWHLLNPKHHKSVGVAERFADGEATVTELRAAHSILLDPYHFTHRSEESHAAAFAGYQVAHGAAYDAARIAAESARLALPPGDAAAAAQVVLLSDLFGNPFCKARFNKKWRTTTAVALAKGMYESRDFSAMPILADALQDAGCDSDDILNHCRDEKATHVRGCWVVDCVLGKD
jgi:hypothetical protein